MAVFEHARPAPFGARTVYQITGLVERLIEEMRVAMRARQVYDALRHLNRGQLTDIGMGEGDLMSQAREIARRAH